jgi:hypothetical protein
MQLIYKLIMLAAGLMGAQLCALAFPKVVFSSAVQTWLWLVAIACLALFAFIESRQKTMKLPDESVRADKT